MSFATWRFIRNCTKADTKRDASLTTPDDIKRFDNILYGTDEKWQILDVYRPKNCSDKLPVIVSVHGGGWVYGDKEVYQYYCMNLAQRGFVVVNFTYRLAPRYKFPAGLEDTNLVFKWVANHADEYGMDLNNIFAVGDSAGGTNVGLYAAMLTNPDYAKRYDFKLPDIKVKAVGLNCGVYNLDKDANNSFKSAMFKNKGDKEELFLISLIYHVTKNYPPCYILGAANDTLKNEIPELTEVLDKYDVTYETKVYGDEEKHPLYHVFHCDIKTEDAKLANDDECNFFRKYMNSQI